MDERRREIEARLADLTPGKWHYEQILERVVSHQENGDKVVIFNSEDDRASDADGFFIAHAPEDIRSLLSEITRLEQERDQAREALKPFARAFQFAPNNVAEDVQLYAYNSPTGSKADTPSIEAKYFRRAAEIVGYNVTDWQPADPSIEV